jgi:HAMP domain-containing protein
MSPTLAVSFLVTLLCVLGAINASALQQYLFVGAALAATIVVCSLEAWSVQEAPVERRVRRDDEIR